jgi:hypothetical protein
MSIPIKTTAEMLADFRSSQFPDRRQLAADYDAIAARLAEAERLLERWHACYHDGITCDNTEDMEGIDDDTTTWLAGITVSASPRETASNG